MPQWHIFDRHMVQNLNFSAKKGNIWLVPILVLAGLFSWANVQGSGQSQAQPVKTELVILTSNSKAAKKIWFTKAKRFAEAISSSTEAYNLRTIQVQLVNQAAIFSNIKSKLSLLACGFWMPRSVTATISC